MTDIAWITDPHFPFISKRATQEFGYKITETLQKLGPSRILLTGDLAEAQSLVQHLTVFRRSVDPSFPIDFVLGNHDFYNGSIEEVRAAVKEACDLLKAYGGLNYLTQMERITLSATTCLIGHDGFYDGGYGNANKTTVELHDFVKIKDLLDPVTGYERSRVELLKKLRSLGEEAANAMLTNIELALSKNYKKIVIATHVPPFREAAWHRGEQSNNDYLPWFSSKAMGSMLALMAADNREVEFEVLCGHTHGEGVAQILPNLFVQTGAARYGSPKIHKILRYS